MPKIRKIKPDKVLIIFDESLLLKNLPNKIAITSLITIPKTAPKTKINFKLGYCIPSPKEARKVLSPSSPIAILKAIIKI